MKLLSLSVRGIKGAAEFSCKLDRPLLLVGPNGAGKSRVKDALDFVFGRRVSGVATDAAQLRAAVGGDAASVALLFETDDGARHTLTRTRTINEKTGAFGRSVVTIDGKVADDEAVSALLGDVSQPPAEAWLAMTPEQLSASLARIAVTRPEADARMAELRPKMADALGPKCPKDADHLSWIGKARDALKAENNAANAEANAAEKSAEQSRQDASADRITPDRLRLMEDTLRTLAEQSKAATARLSGLMSQHESAKGAVDVAYRTLAAARRDLDAAEARYQTDTEWHEQAVAQIRTAKHKAANGGRSQADKAREIAGLVAEVDTIQASISAANAETAQARHAVDEARKLLADAERRLAVARAESDARDAAVGHLRDGRCPTCLQAVGLNLLAQFERAADASHRLADSARVMVEEARAYLSDCEAATVDAEAYASSLAGALDDAQSALSDARVKAAENQDADVARLEERAASLATVAEERKRAVAEAEAKFSAADLGYQSALRAVSDLAAPIEEARESDRKAADLERAALDALNAAQHGAAKHVRWQADIQRRDAAKVRKERIDVAMTSLRAVESALAELGFDVLRDSSGHDIPEHFGTMAYVDGALGIRTRDGVFVSGVGLSGAQREVLTYALDRAIDDVTGRRCRVVTMEADALDTRTLERVLDTLDARHSSTELAAAVVMTCHEIQSGDLSRWNLVRLGTTIPPAPGGGHPVPDVHVAVSPEAVDDVVKGPLAGVAPQAVARALKEWAQEVNTSSPEVNAYVVTPDDDPPEGCPDCDAPLRCEDHFVPDVPAPAHQAQAATVPAAAPALAPAKMPAAMPAWLAKPGDVMIGGGDPAAVDEAAKSVLSELSTGAIELLSEWPGRGAVPDRSMPGHASHAVVQELISARMLTDDPLDCRLTPGGEAAWRTVHDVVPVRTDAQAVREDRPAAPGVGATEAEVEAHLRKANLSVEALRHLGLTRGGLDTATKRTSGIWRRHIAQAFCRRGYTMDFVAQWTSAAADLHPKKARGTGTGAIGDGPADQSDTDEIDTPSE